MVRKEKNNVRVIAFYLPQFHPIPENDNWWGKGFTEWRNVGKARPLFRGHEQPRIPADLGYYDLRVPEIRKQQADMAREYGIEGFCYWHYWFGNGKRLIERPFQEVLDSGEPEFPFCLAWANESWKGFAHGLKNRNTLIEQLYPGIVDYKNHFFSVLPALKDKRYIKVDGKPLFLIYQPLGSPEVVKFIECWRALAMDNGLEGIYFVGQTNCINNSIEEVLKTGVDAVNTTRLIGYFSKRSFFQKLKGRFNKIFRSMPLVYSYKVMSEYFLHEDDRRENVFPCIIPGWDHTPRSGREGLVITNSTPMLFEKHVKKSIDLMKNKEFQHQILFLKSWNEWAEGNYVEPDIKWGFGYLKVLRDNII